MIRWMRFAGIAVLIAAYLALGWVAGVVLALVWLVAFVRDQLRLRRALAPQICPRGHRVETYGVFRFQCCGTLAEGWGFRCPRCGSLANLQCGECGLSVPSPLVP